jgi:hypothetical protein
MRPGNVRRPHPAGEAVSRAPRREVKPRRVALSRRRFMTLLAAGSATALVAPSRAIEAATAPPAKPAAPLPPPKLRAEIEKQKKSTADTLKVIRDYKLAPGSVMAFEFRPLPRKRGK